MLFKLCFNLIESKNIPLKYDVTVNIFNYMYLSRSCVLKIPLDVIIKNEMTD